VIDEPHVAQVALEEAVADEAVVMQRLLDADQIDVRPLHRRRQEKAPLARPDLEDHRLRVAEQLLEVEQRETALARIEGQLGFGDSIHAARKIAFPQLLVAGCWFVALQR
jgi:hypothetical protein